MNDITFSNSFMFHCFFFNSFNYTDNRGGAPQHYFAYMISGNCKIVTETETTEIKEGDIFYIPDKCRYQSYWYGEPEIRFISLGFSYMPNFEGKAYPVQVIPRTEETVGLFGKIPTETRLSAKDIGLFYTLVGLLMSEMKSASLCYSQEIVQKTKRYMSTHPYAKMSEVAKSCSVSEAALYSAFHKQGGLTPNQLRGNLILEQSKELLISTDKTIEEISDLLKFSSASYFRKKFKQYFNMTPKEMRKQHRI